MIALVVVLAVLIMEAALLSFWVASYYRTGPRLFRAKVSAAGRMDAEELEERCGGNLVTSSLAFKALSDDEIAFQEKALPMTVWTPYLPVLRGLIIRGRGPGQSEMVGILLWSPVVAVVAAFLTGVAEGLWSGIAPAAAIAVGVTFMAAMQWSRFNQVRVALERQSEQEAQ